MSDTVSSRIRFGLCLPNFRDGVTKESIDAAAEACARLGWDSLWTTDHVLPDRQPPSRDYATIFDALATLAYLAGRTTGIGLGTSVLVSPMRNAVVLAKEIASIDALSGGRLTLGVGVGWGELEYANVGAAGIFHRRGAYLDESMALWRHLWSGSQEPFHGRFHSFDEFAFAPLPVQGAGLPIWIGGRSDAALLRAGRAGDGWQSTNVSPALFAEMAPKVLAAARDAGRPAPALSARVRVRDVPPDGPLFWLTGTPEQMRADIDAFAAAGATRIIVDLMEPDAEAVASVIERFHRDVASAYAG